MSEPNHLTSLEVKDVARVLDTLNTLGDLSINLSDTIEIFSAEDGGSIGHAVFKGMDIGYCFQGE